jgi:hypothetical protein
MSDADREWTIEHAGEQLYDIVILLDYDETSVKIWRPTAKPTRQPSNKRMARDFRDPGGRRANSGGRYASGLASDGVR